uniref:At2g23090-like zinc-binding domain-containing protein n=1 Tax=Leptocylindrus danicus TaxID=163516 RepID=A0A7S2NWG6_9STRA|mmetsp:Transcript_15676/g.23175  ORF Transcript_15676/g.23175 Transcript_15676/m.23175 type:complete len:137 (+) Transcript_15676:59-469(+)
MGKGSNVQKAQAARERNQKKLGKTDEERRAAAAKSAKDASAYVCLICKQTFMVNATKSVLYLHVTSKHPVGTDPVSCFTQLQGFDPNDPKGLKAKAAEDAKKAELAAKKKKKAAKGGMDDLDALLNAGLTKSKKKK